MQWKEYLRYSGKFSMDPIIADNRLTRNKHNCTVHDVHDCMHQQALTYKINGKECLSTKIEPLKSSCYNNYSSILPTPCTCIEYLRACPCV